MKNLKHYLNKLLKKSHLEEVEAEEAFTLLTQETDPTLIAAFLTSLRMKGETLSELEGAAKAVLKQARPFPPVNETLLDIVGTGGDGKQTYNISTLAALTVAATGIPVAKHGNRAVSSSCGSADLLEKLEIPLAVNEKEACEQLQASHFTFLFAPYYHPAFKKVAEARKALGIRTIFNLLGPLTNPAYPSIRLVGVYDPAWLEKMALTLHQLNCRKAWVVHGGGGSDELDLQGENLVYSLNEGKLERLSVSPEDAGLPKSPLSSIRGGTVEENFKQSLRLLQGESGPLQDAVALNAGAALYLCGKCDTLQKGAATAKEILQKGAVRELVEKLKSAVRLENNNLCHSERSEESASKKQISR